VLVTNHVLSGAALGHAVRNEAAPRPGRDGRCRFPDLDKPSQVFFGFSPFPRVVDRLHAGIHREAPSRMPQEVLVAVAGALIVAALTQRANLRSRPARARRRR
jgi:hypothetical protein